MAETETKAKGGKSEKSDKAPRPEKADKGQPGQKAAKTEKGDKVAKDKAAKGEAGEKTPKARKPEERVTPRLKTYFEEVVRKKLSDEFGYKSALQVPVIRKVVINMGIGEGVNDRKKVEAAANDLSLIAGQKAVITKARKSIATFKVRDGQAIGCKVTLRKARMYEFLDRLVTIAMPRVRDFRGLPGNRGFDGRGNFAMGLKEQIVFPEINYDRVETVRGMDIQFVTTAKTDKEAKALLTAFQLPFAK